MKKLHLVSIQYKKIKNIKKVFPVQWDDEWAHRMIYASLEVTKGRTGEVLK